MLSTAHNRDSSTGDGVKKQKTGSAACAHCHRRKVRCDARVVGLPCSNCRSSGRPDCRIHEKKKRLAPRSILDPVPIRCRPISTSDNASKPLSPTSAELHISPSNAFNVGRPESQPQTATSVSPNQHESQLVDSQLYNRLRLPGGPSEREARADLEKRLVSLIDEDEIDKRNMIRNGVRAIYIGHDLSNMSFLLRQQRDTDDEVYHFAGNEVPRHQLQNGHDSFLIDALTLPEQQLADELIDAYFAYVNPGYPVIDEDFFMRLYRDRDRESLSILLVQSILLVGAHITRPKAERDVLKEIFFRRAKWLFDNRIERNRDILVQAALLLTWYSDIADDDVSVNAYYWIGVAASIAVGLGMHRSPVQGSFISRDRRLWKRLWFLVLQFDVMISVSYGRPQAINLEDSDVSPLMPSDFEDCGARVQVEFVINFTELCAMISCIVRERFGLRVSAERRKAVLPEADEALANWSLKLPDSLRFRTSDMDSWTAMLHLTYNNFLILLHRPHPRAAAYSDDYGPHDAEICSAAAGVIASIFEELRLHDRLKYLWFSAVHTLFTAMIQVRVELRFSNPVLAINGLRRFDSASHSMRALSEYWTNASMILSLFEDSKRLKSRDLRTATSERTRNFSEQHDRTKSQNSSSSNPQAPVQNPQPGGLLYETPTHTSAQQQRQLSVVGRQQVDAWIPTTPNLLPFDRNEALLDDASSVGQMDQPREFSDWRQLFSFTDPDEQVSMPMEGLTELEGEWRQIYWQETPMSDLLQDGGWVQS